MLLMYLPTPYRCRYTLLQGQGGNGISSETEEEEEMKLNLSLPLDAERFIARCNALLQKGAYVELTDKSGRSKAQNS